ncbi:MAG: hypothetical protein K2G28_05610, partial [Acetatifactor sp.]|nr:hypothetical protein [Acetatifactor sp.]
VMTAQPPKELASVLSQEADGQISFLVPENEAMEKQITGQMNIEDILAEWERMKREGAAKRAEEVRQRVLQHTGELFNEFEAAVRDGLLEQLENEKMPTAGRPGVRAGRVGGSLGSGEAAEEELEYLDDISGSGAEENTEEISEESSGEDYEGESEENLEDFGEFSEESGEDYEGESEEALEESGEALEEDAGEDEALEYMEESSGEDYEGESEEALEESGEDYEGESEETLEDSGEALEEDFGDAGEDEALEYMEESSGEDYEGESEEPLEESGEALEEDAEDAGEDEVLEYMEEPSEEDYEGESEETLEDSGEDYEEESEETPEESRGASKESGEALEKGVNAAKAAGNVPAKNEAAKGAEDDSEEEAAPKGSTAEKSSEKKPLSNKKKADASVEREKAKVRALTNEEKELFAPFIQNRSGREMLVKAIDSISLAAYTGNIIVTGEEGMDTITLAKNLIREVQITDSNFSGKVAKITGQGLNAQKVPDTLKKVRSGALIIEKASGMDEAAIEALHQGLQQDSLGVIVLMEDTRRAMNKMLEAHPGLAESFTARVDLEPLSNDKLVAFGKHYAREMEYSIDDMGALALHTRIEERQTIDHVVTVMEVKQIVDGAIRHANRKTLGHFLDILFAKRYDEEDMIILTEKDFA